MGIADAVRGIAKPHYLFRPLQLVRRVRWRQRRRGRDRVTVQLPWGMPIRCFAGDAIGLSLQQLGVFDLSVAETLWRLADRGEWAVDVGANVGQMTSVLARRVGPTGRVLAFEPNGDVRAELTFNAGIWAGDPAAGPIDVSAVGLSDHDGEGLLLMPAWYEWNRGIAEVVEAGDSRPGERHRIQVARLDTIVPPPGRVGVMKVDVEGHEPFVLSGAAALLASHRVRDVVYEDHARYPSAVSQLLEARGYTVLAVGSTLWGPRLAEAASAARVPSWESPSYLATANPERARRRLAPRGWRTL